MDGFRLTSVLVTTDPDPDPTPEVDPGLKLPLTDPLVIPMSEFDELLRCVLNIPGLVGCNGVGEDDPV